MSSLQYFPESIGGKEDNLMSTGCSRPDNRPDNRCPEKKGTILRIFIPAGAEVNLLGLIEISSPGGICIIVRLPFLGGKKDWDWGAIANSIKQAGGTIELLQE